MYDRTHYPKSNGKNLIGHISAFQSCRIFSKPGSNHIYFIFTTDVLELPGEGGYAYSEVGLNLSNGLGDITTRKNVVLLHPTPNDCVLQAPRTILTDGS